MRAKSLERCQSQHSQSRGQAKKERRLKVQRRISLPDENDGVAARVCDITRKNARPGVGAIRSVEVYKLEKSEEVVTVLSPEKADTQQGGSSRNESYLQF